MKKLKGSITNVVIEFGEALAPVVSFAAVAIKNLGMAISSIPAGMKTFIAGFVALVGALSAVSAPLLLFVGFLPKIVAGFKAISLAATGVIGPIALIAAGVIAASAAWAYFATSEERAKQATTDNIKSIKDAIDESIINKQETLRMAEGYIKLSGKTKKTKEDTEKLQTTYKRLNREYPEMNSKKSLQNSSLKVNLTTRIMTYFDGDFIV
jgi:hypothetical protein